MAFNFDNFMSESDNVSLEDLSFESFIETDFDPDSITLNDLFEDRLSVFNQTNSSVRDDVSEQGLFDIDIECTDIGKVWISDCDISDSFQFNDINLTDFDPTESSVSAENDDVYVNENIDANDSESTDLDKKHSNIIRRQSTRIQNQTRKKIAEQIQRENIRLAMEAQYLNSNHLRKKVVDQCTVVMDDILKSSGAQKPLALATDLDAEEEEVGELKVDVNNDELSSDDEDPNKLWCICRQPYGERFMICCDNCLEWYHGDCVGISQKEGTTMDEFICPPCVTNSVSNSATIKSEQVVVIDDDEEEDDEELISQDDDDCLITKAVEPMKFNSNIFQLLKKTDECQSDKPNSPKPHVIKLSSLSSRTSVCLNPGCKTLVNPKKSLYCSRICIDKYTKMVIKNNHREKAKQYGLPKGPKLAKMTRFVLAQPATDTIQDEFAAPTEETLKEFLLKNPTYKVYQSSKPVKTKQDKEKSKKILELLNKDPSKHIKIVKHFATLFKKSMPQKSFKSEFRNIWQHCVKIEATIFDNCDKLINDTYMLKVKQMSESLRNEDTNKLCWDILHGKLSICDLLSMNKTQLETRSKVVVLDDQMSLVADKVTSVTRKIPSVATRGGISLLADTTHLHGKHLYDINCKICNGASKSGGDNKNKELCHSKVIIDEKPVVVAMESIITSHTEPEESHDEILSPTNNNDEFKVTSSVATPDMITDMEICSTPSDKDCSESNIINDLTADSKVDSSSNDVIITSVSVKPQKRKLVSLWEGDLTYKEVGTVSCKSYLVTRMFLDKKTSKESKTLPGNAADLRDEMDIGSSLDSKILINGRSDLVVVQDYFQKLRKHSNKEFIILRLHPANLDEGRQTYLSMFEYFHSRERCGVISHKKMGVKDCFVYPLNAHAKVPAMFLPFVGPGLEKSRPHLLLMLLVRSPLTQQYQPISPKYDHGQDHEFVKKHGINLDKYYKPIPNPPFCPSPIAFPDTNAKSDINHQHIAIKEDFCKVKSPKEDVKSESKVELKVIIKDELKFDSKEEIIDKTKETILSVCDANSEQVPQVLEILEIDLLNIPLPPPLPDNVIKKPTEPPQPVKVTTIVRNTSSQLKPISCPVSISLSSVLSTSAPVVVADSPVSTIPPLQNVSFTPQPFVYRSLVKSNHKVQDSNNNTSLSLPDVSSPSHHIDSQETLIDLTSPQDTDIRLTSQLCSPLIADSFCQDVDFRVPVMVNQDQEQVSVISPSMYLKRKDSDRLYTFYDSFVNDDSSESKRRKYFFNPHNAISRSDPCGPSSPSPPSPQISLAPVNGDQKLCDGIMLKKNMSVFSPPGDSFKG